MIKSILIASALLFIGCTKPPLTGSASENFDTQITEKYWKLTAIPGYILQPGFNREPHMILRSHGDSFKGNGGCNTISGVYKMEKNGEIRFSKIMSTETACPALETEQVFMKILESTDQYKIVKDTLILLRDHQSLARFETVYFH